MEEISYEDALAAGISPNTYRTEILKELGEGIYPAHLDALVWGHYGSRPHLQALLTLAEDGTKVRIAAYHQDNRRGEVLYRGFREFCPGTNINLVISIGPRGGVRAFMQARK